MKVHDGDSDVLELSTGKWIQPNGGYIGINSNLNTAQGYDGPSDEDEWTPEERREVADYMIQLWAKWRDRPNE